jgi:transposase
MPDEEERPPTGVDAGTVERRSQLAPGRKRQRRPPVQLWGQLLRPCRVLGAATDTWSLQRWIGS